MEQTKAQTETQIEELVSQLTLEEKIGMIHGNSLFCTKGAERLGIPPLVTSDGPLGVRMEFQRDNWIPLGNTDDCVTYNPSNAALAATWNPDRAYAAGQTLGEEARGRGKDVILAPGINIKRDPLCGRNFEYMSEDPCLIESLAVPFIKGVQENDVATCVKHFAVNNQETDRLAVDTYVDERTLREIYLPAFQAAVQEGGSYSLMNAYNKFRGKFCSESGELLDDILRGEWGYDGTVISDWGSVHSTKSVAEVSMDIEMSVTSDFDDYYLANPLLEAVRKGEVREECIDQKVRNILRMMFRLKMLGEEAEERKPGAYNTPEHRQNTLEIARESVVLLKNEAGKAGGGKLLPLTEERLRQIPVGGSEEGVAKGGGRLLRKHKIAVIGHNADCAHSNGGGSAEVKALYEITPLHGLKKALGGNAEIVYARGYYVPRKKNVSEVNWQEASLERQVMGEEQPGSANLTGSEEQPGAGKTLGGREQESLRKEIEENRARLKAEAVELARSADTVIFVGGLDHDYDVEGKDRRDMKLPYGQDELIQALLDVNPDTIVVMVAGSPVEMPWADRVKALVWCYYAGMETGTALADIMLGKVNPSGKLPETFPVVYTDTATSKNGQFGLEGRVEYLEGIFVGYRYYEKEGIKPAFPFGYGLSYTDFAMEHLCAEISGGTSEEDDINVVVSVDVTNVGRLSGAEVVQCYVADCECSVPRPVKELKAYKKVFLQPGEKQTVTMELRGKAFAFYDTERKKFVVEPGRFLIFVGNASDHCPLQTEVVL